MVKIEIYKYKDNTIKINKYIYIHKLDYLIQNGITYKYSSY